MCQRVVAPSRLARSNILSQDRTPGQPRCTEALVLHVLAVCACSPPSTSVPTDGNAQVGSGVGVDGRRGCGHAAQPTWTPCTHGRARSALLWASSSSSASCAPRCSADLPAEEHFPRRCDMRLRSDLDQATERIALRGLVQVLSRARHRAHGKVFLSIAKHANLRKATIFLRSTPPRRGPCQGPHQATAGWEGGTFSGTSHAQLALLGNPKRGVRGGGVRTN